MLSSARLVVLRKSYSAEAIALFARMTTQPDTLRKIAINNLIATLKTAGIWTKLDTLYLFASHSSQAARLNWVRDLYNPSALNSPSFTIDRGYAGNATTSYLDTGFQPAVSAGSLASQNSAHVGSWSLDNADSTGADVGNNSTRILPRSSGNMTSRCNDLTAATVAVADSLGHSCISRNASGAYSRYRAAVALADASINSTTPAAFSLFICALNGSGTPTGFSSRREAAVHTGSGLSASEVAVMNTALSTYLSAIGAI